MQLKTLYFLIFYLMQSTFCFSMHEVRIEKIKSPEELEKTDIKEIKREYEQKQREAREAIKAKEALARYAFENIERGTLTDAGFQELQRDMNIKDQIIREFANYQDALTKINEKKYEQLPRTIKTQLKKIKQELLEAFVPATKAPTEPIESTKTSEQAKSKKVLTKEEVERIQQAQKLFKEQEEKSIKQTEEMLGKQFAAKAEAVSTFRQSLNEGNIKNATDSAKTILVDRPGSYLLGILRVAPRENAIAVLKSLFEAGTLDIDNAQLWAPKEYSLEFAVFSRILDAATEEQLNKILNSLTIGQLNGLLNIKFVYEEGQPSQRAIDRLQLKTTSEVESQIRQIVSEKRRSGPVPPPA